MAQRLGHLVWDQDIGGSNPPVPKTKRTSAVQAGGFEPERAPSGSEEEAPGGRRKRAPAGRKARQEAAPGDQIPLSRKRKGLLRFKQGDLNQSARRAEARKRRQEGAGSARRRVGRRGRKPRLETKSPCPENEKDFSGKAGRKARQEAAPQSLVRFLSYSIIKYLISLFLPLSMRACA